MRSFAAKPHTSPYTWLALVFVLLAGASSMMAQTNYGSIRGEVKDVQGGLVSNAKVTLTNEDTKVSRSEMTNSAGSYLFGGVDPGTYKVTVTVAGFKTFETNGNIVAIGTISTVDAALAIGATTETIEVTSNTLVLNTASASGGQLFSEQQIQELPSLGRNPFLLASLDANVVTLGDPRYVRAEDSTGSSQVSLAGAPSGTNSYAVDGIPVSTSSGGETYIVSPDAVSEAKVQTNTYDSEVGRTGGGVFANSLKVGTSQYHGELYGETRQTPWSANVWYNVPNSTTGLKAATPGDTTYLYSGAFGGPLTPSWVKKPHWLDNTFFWVTEEGYRQGQPNTGTNTFYVPTAAERTGDYSADAVLLYDPTQRATSGTDTCRLSKLGDCGAAGGAADPLNVLPSSYINPIGNFVLSVIPTATNSNTYAQGANYILATQTFKTRSDEYVGKLEHTFAPWWTTSASYLHDAIQEPGLEFLVTNYCNCTKLIRYFDSTIVNNSFTVNSSTLLTVGYGFNRYYSSAPQYSTGFNSTNGFGGSGFPSSFASQQQSKTFPGFAFTNVTNFTGTLIGSASGGPTVQASNNFVAVLTKTLGRNTFKAGYVFRQFNYRTSPTTGSAGIFSFNGQYTVANGASASGNGPAAFADAQLGLPSSATFQINAGPFFNKETYHSFFLQDDIRLNDKITINAGIRYEYELGQYEGSNKYNVGFNPNATSSYTNSAGATISLKGGLEFAGVNGSPIHCCQPSHAKFSPRIGVAYSPVKDIVVHAGFGLFYAPVGIAPETAGYSQVTSYAPGNATGPAAVGSNAYLSSPFTSGGTSVLLQPTGNTLGPLTGVGGALAVQATNRQYPYVEQYSLDVQQQLPKDVIVKIAYVGAHGNNFFNSVNINQLPNSVLASYAPGGANFGQSLATKVTNPYSANTIGGIPATGTASAANKTIAQGQLLLPFPQFTSISVSESDGYSWYNSLAIKVEKRMARGLTVLGTYTWSSNWDNLYGTGSQVFSTYGAQDNTNIGAEYARSLNSIPNRVTAAVVYELPVGRGRKYLGTVSGLGGHLRDAAVGGWTINYEVVDQNGVPLSVIQTDLSTNLGTTGVGGSYQRPNLVGDPHSACVGGSPQTRLGQANGVSNNPNARAYVNQAAFTAAPAYTYGNTSRSLPCRAPGSNTTTASITKTFNIYENVKFQFRAEALNLYNTPQFGYPTTTLGVAQASATTAATVNAYGASGQSFGNLNSQIGFGRIIQLGGRISF